MHRPRPPGGWRRGRRLRPGWLLLAGEELLEAEALAVQPGAWRALPLRDRGLVAQQAVLEAVALLQALLRAA